MAKLEAWLRGWRKHNRSGFDGFAREMPVAGHAVPYEKG